MIDVLCTSLLGILPRKAFCYKRPDSPSKSSQKMLGVSYFPHSCTSIAHLHLDLFCMMSLCPVAHWHHLRIVIAVLSPLAQMMPLEFSFSKKEAVAFLFATSPITFPQLQLILSWLCSHFYPIKFCKVFVPYWRHSYVYETMSMTWLCFPGSLAGKESACHAGDPDLIPGSRRSSGE